jgi:hypothetical protein
LSIRPREEFARYDAAYAEGPTRDDPRTRYLRLLQAWVECRPHQPAKRRFVEGALARCRRLAVRAVTP